MEFKLFNGFSNLFRSHNNFLINNKEPNLKAPVSQLVTKQQCDSNEFKFWKNELLLDLNSRWLERNQTYNRKIWEWVYILQSLENNKLLNNQKKGLGFGVGKEPLVAAIAKFGCKILATDLPNEDAVKNGWDNFGQYSFNISDLNNLGICEEQKFTDNASHRFMDMNCIDSDLSGFDFVYSSCALEHLGSLEKGMDFIYNSLNCIKEGGIAIHTTEFNVTSDNETIKDGPTVIYRKKDIVEMAEHLTKNGCKMKVNFSTGNTDIDQQYDIPPYFEDKYHLKLLMDKYVITSIGIIIHKKR